MLRVLGAIGLGVVAAWAAGCGGARADESIDARARRLLSEVPLIDGHNDLPWQFRSLAKNDVSKIDLTKRDPRLHTDLPKLAEGGLGAQFWSVFVPVSMKGSDAVRATMEQIDVVYRLVDRYPDRFGLAFSADDIEREFAAGRIASLMGIEGGHCIDDSLGTLRMFYRLGVRYMTLTHSKNTSWADACSDDAKVGGLNAFGESVVREMNRLGMLVDLSHVAVDTMLDALRVTKAPVIFSHSSARALCDTTRNVPDRVLAMLPENGGVCMVTFVPSFLNEDVRGYGKKRGEERDRLKRVYPGEKNEERRKEELTRWSKRYPPPRATLAEVADHIEHIVKIAGVDHVGIGGDYDGIEAVPVGLEDVSKYPALVEELLRRGCSDADVKKILGENLLRVFRAAERVAAALDRGEGTGAK